MLQLRSVPQSLRMNLLIYFYNVANVFIQTITPTMHRQPFQTFPQTLLLQETFTVDLVQGLYILESKGGLHGNREVIHTLTLGYQPPSPFVSVAQVDLLIQRIMLSSIN